MKYPSLEKRLNALKEIKNIIENLQMQSRQKDVYVGGSILSLDKINQNSNHPLLKINVPN
jgi:hypothetical protein